MGTMHHCISGKPEYSCGVKFNGSGNNHIGYVTCQACKEIYNKRKLLMNGLTAEEATEMSRVSYKAGKQAGLAEAVDLISRQIKLAKLLPLKIGDEVLHNQYVWFIRHIEPNGTCLLQSTITDHYYLAHISTLKLFCK